MKNLFGIFFLVFSLASSFAQNPNWSVNANNYQFSMTFTASLNTNGTTLSSPNDRVAAFVNGEIRGVAGVSYIPRLDKYVSYLTVYANTNRETINFKIYDSTNNDVVDISKTIQFNIDGNVGSAFQALSLAKPVLSNQAEITAFSFNGIQEKSVNISGNSIDVLLPSETAINNLDAFFTTSNGAKVFFNDVKLVGNTNNNDFSNPITYQVVSADESVLKEYTLTVTVEEIIILPDFVVNLISDSNSVVTQKQVAIQLATTQEITGVKKEDFVLENAVLQNITKVNNSTYNLSLIAIKQGEFSIQLLESKVTTIRNTGNNASNKLTFTLNSQQPYLVSMLRRTPTAATTNADSLQFVATFNKLVTGVLVTDFETVAGATLSLQKLNATKYIITVSNVANFEGTVSVRLKATNNIKDVLGASLRTSTYKNY